MKRGLLRAAPHWAVVGLILFAVVGLLWMPSPAAAADTDVVTVEEDWELVVNEPDTSTVGPQITCTMSPFNNLNDTYFTLEVNHLSAPSFSPGGLHIHMWGGDWRLASYSRPDRSVLNTNHETITWTQALIVGNGRLKFQVKDGVSTTWGIFGYTNLLAVEKGWGVNNINSYTPAASVANSGVGFASNRVGSLKLKRVRYTLANGQIVTDNTERVVFAQE